MDLSVVILALDEKKSISEIIHTVSKALPDDVLCELVVSDGKSVQVNHQSKTIISEPMNFYPGYAYGLILKACFEKAQGTYVITLDADLDQAPLIIRTLWEKRDLAEVVIASNMELVGKETSPSLSISSILLRKLTIKMLSLPTSDFSSGFRLYQNRVLQELNLSGQEMDILPEILVQSHANGRLISQTPVDFKPRFSQNSHLFKPDTKTCKNLFRMWRLRNSIDSADYDERAFFSKIPFQRFWQRARHRIITGMVQGSGSILDIGCGSSRILHDIQSIIGLDIRANKLRYMKRYDKEVVNGTIFTLPFTSESFDCVICSEVIEHIPFDHAIFSEMYRVLRFGGTLIIGTPDYGSINWPIIEAVYQRVLPNGYADEHITHYSLSYLSKLLEQQGYCLQQTSSILGAEVILCLKKIHPSD